MLVVRGSCAATVPAGANGFKDFAQLIQGGRTAAHLIMVAAAKPKRKHAVEPAGRKHVRLGFDGVSPSLFRERLFLKDGRVCLRIHRGMGKGFWLSKTRADGMLAGGRKHFVALLMRCRLGTAVRHYGGTLEDQPAHNNCASVGRPMFTKDEHTKVQATKDAGAMATAFAKVAKALQQQRSAKDIQTAKGWFPCLQLDPTESCYCECSFQRAHGLAQHIERHTCRFPRAPGGTAGRVQKLYCDLMQPRSSSSSSSSDSSPRLDAAAAARPGVVVKPAHGALVGFSISDDAQQNAGHLLAHRFAAREMQLRCRALRRYNTYENKSDGAGVYASIQQWMALRIMHEVDARYPRCTGSSQSVAGDGKGACDRYHAENNAKSRRELHKGKDQTNAHDHAVAQTSGGGVKGTTVCVVIVERGVAALEFKKLEYVDAGPAADEPLLEEADAADREFNPDSLTMREWATQRGAGHTSALPREYRTDATKKAVGTKFVDKHFDEGATGAKGKVQASTVRELMVEAVDPETGLAMFGPGCIGGEVWDLKDINARYSARFSKQKGAALYGNNASSIETMKEVKCGCGPAKSHQLGVIAVNTLGDLLALHACDDKVIGSKLAGCRNVTVAAVHRWATKLLAARAGAGVVAPVVPAAPPAVPAAPPAVPVAL